MDRTEEHRFRQDVYTVLIRMTNFRASGFLSGERKACKDDSVFFSELLNSSDQLLGKAFRQGKLTALYTEPFLHNYQTVVNDDLAYLAFLHQDELSILYGDIVFGRFSDEEARIRNAFTKYWRDYCARSIKVLYYRLLITNPTAPKYQGLGDDASRVVYRHLLDIKAEVDKYLKPYLLENPEPEAVPDTELTLQPDSIVTSESEDKEEAEEEEYQVAEELTTDAKEQDAIVSTFLDDNSLPFLSYVYDTIVSAEFPASALLLSVLRSRCASENEFYRLVLEMDVTDARKRLGIGEVSAKEVNRLCDMMRKIVSHPGSRIVFENSDKVDLCAPRIEKRLEGEDIRTFHAYQKFMESCNGSVLNLYLRVVGLPPHRIKVPGLNVKKSLALFDFLKIVLPEVVRFISQSQKDDSFGLPNSTTSITVVENTKPSLLYRPALHKFGFSDEELDRIVSTNDRLGHFPLFTAVSILFSRMDDRMKTIAQRTLSITFGNPLEELTDVASSLSLSRERVRQLRETCLKELLGYPKAIDRAGLLDGFIYQTQSEYDFRRIREEENVDFSDDYITVCVSTTTATLTLIGNYRDALLKPSSPSRRLYLVPKSLHAIFSFILFINKIEEMIKEKRFYPYRDDLETFVRSLLTVEIPDEDFYAIVRECRNILLKGYPDNIINSQVYFPANARKTIPNLIEDILREFNRPMTAEEICEQLNQRYPDLEQVPSKIGPNALRNSNIVAVSRSSTYALVEWDHTEKRGGTIRDLAVEYLNSLFQPIAPLSDICEYIAKFREDVKESSVKANLWAESNNRFSMYYKVDVLYVGFSDYSFGDEFVLQEKRQGRRTFKDSIERLEKFIKENGHFPFTSGVDAEEARLSRFYGVAKANQKKGVLSDEELAEIERIDTTYGQLKVKKERVSWDERLESFVKYITDNDALPNRSSKEYTWYEENKELYDAGELDPERAQSFAFLMKIVKRMGEL